MTRPDNEEFIIWKRFIKRTWQQHEKLGKWLYPKCNQHIHWIYTSTHSPQTIIYKHTDNQHYKIHHTEHRRHITCHLDQTQTIQAPTNNTPIIMNNNTIPKPIPTYIYKSPHKEQTFHNDVRKQLKINPDIDKDIAKIFLE